MLENSRSGTTRQPIAREAFENRSAFLQTLDVAQADVQNRVAWPALGPEHERVDLRLRNALESIDDFG